MRIFILLLTLLLLNVFCDEARSIELKTLHPLGSEWYWNRFGDRPATGKSTTTTSTTIASTTTTPSPTTTTSTTTTTSATTTTMTTTTLPKLVLLDAIGRFNCYRGEICEVFVDESSFNYRNLTFELDSDWLFQTSKGSFIGVPTQAGLHDIGLSVRSSIDNFTTTLEVFVNTQDGENNYIKISFERSVDDDSMSKEMELCVDFARQFSDHFNISYGDYFLQKFDGQNQTAIVKLTDLLCDSVDKAKMERAAPFTHSMGQFENVSISIRTNCPVTSENLIRDILLIGVLVIVMISTVVFSAIVSFFLYNCDDFDVEDGYGNDDNVDNNDFMFRNDSLFRAEEDFSEAQRFKTPDI